MQIFTDYELRAELRAIEELGDSETITIPARTYRSTIMTALVEIEEGNRLARKFANVADALARKGDQLYALQERLNRLEQNPNA